MPVVGLIRGPVLVGDGDPIGMGVGGIYSSWSSFEGVPAVSVHMEAVAAARVAKLASVSGGVPYPPCPSYFLSISGDPTPLSCSGSASESAAYMDLAAMCLVLSGPSTSASESGAYMDLNAMCPVVPIVSCVSAVVLRAWRFRPDSQVRTVNGSGLGCDSSRGSESDSDGEGCSS